MKTPYTYEEAALAAENKRVRATTAALWELVDSASHLLTALRAYGLDSPLGLLAVFDADTGRPVKSWAGQDLENKITALRKVEKQWVRRSLPKKSKPGARRTASRKPARSKSSR